MNFLVWLFLIFIAVIVFNNYQKCGRDNILVIYNKNFGKPIIKKIVRSGGSNIIPFIQGGLTLSVIPITQRVDLHNISSKENERLSIFFLITTEFPQETDALQKAINNFAGYNFERILNKIKDVAINYFITEISKTYISEMNDEEWFIKKLDINLKIELRKIGVNLKNIVIGDIKQGNL